MRADVYLAANDPLQAWAREHRVARAIQGEQVRCAPIEYVIVQKLRCARRGGSERHLRDIARMLEVNAGAVDLPVLERWIAHLELALLWAPAQSLAGRE